MAIPTMPDHSGVSPEGVPGSQKKGASSESTAVTPDIMVKSFESDKKTPPLPPRKMQNLATAGSTDTSTTGAVNSMVGQVSGKGHVVPVVLCESEHFVAYQIHNEKGYTFPPNVQGAIGITFDTKVEGITHKIVYSSFLASSLRNNIDPLSSDLIRVNLSKAMHAFVVLEEKHQGGEGGVKQKLAVGEAVGQGVVKGEIQIGDKDWTSLVLFVPKDQKLAERTAKNVALDTVPDKNTQTVAPYASFKGFVSSFVNPKEDAPESKKKRLAYAMADYIKEQSVRDPDNQPKACICSALAIRTLHSSWAIMGLKEEKMEKYQSMDRDELANHLIKKMSKETSNLSQKISAIGLFELNSSATLPYQLYLELMKGMEKVGSSH